MALTIDSTARTIDTTLVTIDQSQQMTLGSSIVFSADLQAPIALSNPTGAIPMTGAPPQIIGKFPTVPAVGSLNLVTAAVRLALAMASSSGSLALASVAPGFVQRTVTPRVPTIGAVSVSGAAPTLTTGTAQALTFPRIALIGNGGDQSYGSNATTGYPKWTTAAAGSAANIAIQTIGSYDLVILAGVFEGWDTSGARDREDLAQALLKNTTYAVTKNAARPTLSFFYHIQSEGNPSGSGTGYDLLIAQINAMNGWLYESSGGVGTKTPSAFAGATLINHSVAWPNAIGSAAPGQGIVGTIYGSTSAGPTGAQGVARMNGSYAADKLLIKGSTGDTRWTFNAQMAAPSAAGVFLDNCFVALDGAGTVANSSLDGITIAPGAQQGGGFPALDTVQPVMARGVHDFFDQMLTTTATFGTPGKVYLPFGNIGQFANKYQFGTATLTAGLENTMKGGLLEDVIGAGAPSWEYQQTGKAGGGNWTSGWINVLANYYQGMDFCLAPKAVVLGARLPSASTPSSWVNGGGSTLVSVTAGSALEYQEMRYGLCTALLDDGYFGVGVSGYDWAGGRWYDEFGDDSLAQVNVKRGYLGLPLSVRPSAATWAQGTMGVWSRSFTNGIAIVNPRGNGAQTVALTGSYTRLQGTQQPTINNGATGVTSVSLADGDGLILLGPVASTSFNHGDLATINGSNFGATMPTFSFIGGKTGAIETTALGATPNLGTNSVQNDTNPLNSWNFQRYNAGSASNTFITTLNDAIRGEVLGANLNSQSGTIYEPSIEYTFPGNIPIGGAGAAGKVYVTYYARGAYTTYTGPGPQHKLLRLTARPSHIEDSEPNFVFHYLTGDLGIISNSVLGDANNQNFGGLSNYAGDGSWCKIEIRVETNTVAGTRNGKLFIRVFPGNLVPTYDNPTNVGSHTDALQSAWAGYPDSGRYGAFIWQNWCGNGYNVNFANDDHYVSIGDYRRVEIWNAAAASSATKRETQRPTAWSNTSITVEINKGGLPAGTYYLTVLADNATDTILAQKQITLTGN